jgi:hypothetical protein
VTEETREDPGGLRERLASLPQVDHVAIDEATREALLILDASADAAHVEAQARSIAGEYVVRCVLVPEHRDRQRVRFVDVRRDVEADQSVRFTVTLEWAGTEYVGEAVGEKGEHLELRTVAAASLEAVTAVVPADLQVRLAGVKQVRAFDADLIIISLYRHGGTPHNLVGAVVTGPDTRRAAAVAVLNALNRLLGNYLRLP